MLFNSQISLIKRVQDPEHPTDEVGNPVYTETARTVYANQKSVRQSEFYQAAVAGLKPQLMFEVRRESYQGEALLDVAGQRYHIIRTYAKNTEILEIVCGGALGDEP